MVSASPIHIYSIS
uniref:Uncharacterized protein n=1 Tax=Arundo donax TaxID=35708 RepID=A0A0A9AL73_ARUDO